MVDIASSLTNLQEKIQLLLKRASINGKGEYAVKGKLEQGAKPCKGING